MAVQALPVAAEHAREADSAVAVPAALLVEVMAGVRPAEVMAGMKEAGGNMVRK